MKKLFFLLLRLIFLGIAASSFIYTSVLVQAQETKPIDQEITIADLVIKEDHEALKVDMVFPAVQGIKDKQVEEKINQTIQKDVLNFKEMLQTESEKCLQGAKEEGWEIRKYIATIYYIVHYQKDDLLSFSVFYYSYTLGAHGHTLQRAYNFNLVNGEEILLSDILKEKKDYVDIINQEIKRQIKLNPQEYFSEWSVFKSISEEQPFYLIEDGIVVYFGLYEIAPYASGIRYFKIPYSLFGHSQG
ncbi:DUF3298 and DUF4163 domain-containing protein [bacterium]|nr:DUF3298 and DUF4163 domain-containing protein [bacterium]